MFFWIYAIFSKVLLFQNWEYESPWNTFQSCIISTLAKISLSLWHLHGTLFSCLLVFLLICFWDFLSSKNQKIRKINISTHMTLIKAGNFSSKSICQKSISSFKTPLYMKVIYFIFQNIYIYILCNYGLYNMVIQNYYFKLGRSIAKIIIFS